MPSAAVRLLCESRSQSRTVRDSATQERPFYWRGSSVDFQLALVSNGTFLVAADVGTIVVELKHLDSRAVDDSLMRKEYVAADCDETFTPADWAGGAKALLTASFTVNEAAILPGTYRLIVTHEDGDGEINIHLSTELAVLDPQTGSEGIDPPPIAWQYLDGVPVLRTDVAQDLSPAEQAQAFENLGFDPASKADTNGQGIDPLAFRSALQTRLPIVLNEERLDRFAKAAQSFEVAGLPPAGTYLGIGAFGDSMGDPTAKWIVMEAIQRFGLGALGTTKFTGAMYASPNDVLTETASGGATDLGASPGLNGYSPQSTAWNLPAGGKVTVTRPATANLQGPWRKLQVWHMIRAGGGSITVNVIQNGATVFSTTVSTAGATGMAVIEVTEANGLLCGVSPTVEVIASGAACYYLGTLYFADRGVVPLCHCRGGISLNVQNTVPNAVLSLFQANVPMHLMVHSMKEDEISEPDPLMPQTATHMDRMAAYFPQASHVFVGQSPTATLEAEDASRTLRLRVLALQKDLCYLDAFQAAKSYANLTALAWNGDGTHLSADGFWRFVAGVFIARISSIFNPGGLMPANLARRQMLHHACERIPAYWTGTLPNQHLAGTGSTSSTAFTWRQFLSGASVGSAAGSVMVLRSAVNRIMTPSQNFAFLWHSAGSSFVGSGRGWIQIGCGDANYTAPDKTRLSFGVEMALPSNVGLTDATNHAYRIWCFDGVTLRESPWGTTPSGSASLDIANLLTWDSATETFQLRAVGAANSTPALPLVTALRVPAFSGKTLQGQNAIFGAAATVAAETANVSLSCPPEAIYPSKNPMLGLF